MIVTSSPLNAITKSNIDDMTDHELTRAIEASYDALLHRAWTLLHNGEDARDAVQQAVMEAWERRATMCDVENLGGYLYGMVTHVCMHRLRDSGRHTVVHQALADVMPLHINPDPFGLEHLLQPLTDLQRNVVQLHDIEGYSCFEVAIKLGRTPVAVRKQLALAHKTMREYGKD